MGGGFTGESGSRRGEASLLERDAACSRLDALLAAAAAGDGCLALVEGDAGLGKTRLLSWVAGQAGDRAMLACTARAAHHEQTTPYGVVVALFERVLAALPAGERAEVLSGAAELAAPLFDSRRWDGAEQQDAVAHGVFWLILNLAARGPLLIVVDDLHWCDAASLRVLLYAAHRIADVPALLLAAWRPREPDATQLAGELAALSGPRRIELQRLSDPAIARLLADELDAQPSDRFVAACAHATGGNPFLLHAVIRSLRDDDIRPSDEHARRIDALRPQAVVQQALVRIARRGPDASALAAAVALLGDGARLVDAARLAELEMPAASTAVDALTAAGVLVGATTLSFTHPLLQGIVSDQIPPGRRADLHLRAAALLRESGAGAHDVAAHLLESPVGGGDWVIDALRRAAAGAPAAAPRFLMRALREAETPQLRGELLLELGRAEAAEGEPEARVHLEEALTLADDPQRRALAHRRLGELLLAGGDRRGAAEQFEGGLQAAGDGDERLTRDLHAGYFTAASLVPELAERALAHVMPLLGGEAGGETPMERAVLAIMAAHRVTSGAPRDEAIALARRAWGDGALLRDEGPDGTSWTLVTAALGWGDEFSEAAAVADRVRDEAQRRGLRMAHATASYVSQLPAYMAGDLIGALAHGEAALEARGEGWNAYAIATAAVQALILVDRDQLDDAQALLDELPDPATAPEAEMMLARAAQGRLALARDDAAGALEHHLASGELAGRLGFENSTISPWRGGAALACRHLGRIEQARELAAQEMEVARRAGAPTQIARALRTAAALTNGDDEVAALREAVAVLDGSGGHIERLRAQAQLGGALRRAGSRREARDVLGAAHDTASGYGAWRILTHVREELRIAGARPRRLSFSGADALTAGQRRVCLMAADGMSNREIAQALFVTPRTVEQHLYNAYKKLGIASRAELGDALATPG